MPDPSRDTAWQAALAPYYRELGLAPDTGSTAAGRAPFDVETAELIRAFQPPVVSFHFGLPAPELLARQRRPFARRCGNRALAG